MRRDHWTERQQIFTRNIARLIEYIYSKGYKCTFGESFRTREQAALYAKTGIGMSDSNHCYRLAMDLNIFDANGKYLTDTKDYAQFGKYWESLDPFNESGAFWKSNPDGNHFEMD
jgi:hypothetical protein